ncbi:MAG: outer membrane beta-barrel protein [bacterium]
MKQNFKIVFNWQIFLGIMLFAVFLPFAAANKAFAVNPNANTGTDTNANIKKIEKKLDKALTEINAMKKQNNNQNNYFSNMQLLGTLVGSYTYNLAKPAAINTPGAFEGNGNYGDNWQPDGFAVNNADITLRRSPGTSSNPYGVGFHISLDFGQNIQFYKAYYGNTSYFTAPFQDRTPYDIRKAYININLPVGSGLDIHIGKEQELLGFEAFNPIRNWNNTYSLLDAVEPATLTGVFLTYNFVPALTSTLGIANTINSAVPIDNLPVIELNESYAATGTLTFNGGFVYGENSYLVGNGTGGSNGGQLYEDNMNKSFYGYIDAVLSPTPDWSFVADYELGLGGGINNSVLSDNGLAASQVAYPALVQTSNAAYDQSRFYGIAGYIHQQHNYAFGQVAETLREVGAYDQNGLWEMTSTPGTGYTYVDSTLTIAYLPSFKGFKNIQFRLEFEHQGSNHDVYLDSAGSPTHSQQNTLNLMVLYSF